MSKNHYDANKITKLFWRKLIFFDIIKTQDIPSQNAKVEKNLKGTLNSIPTPSPSVQIQIVGGKVFLSCKGKRLLGVVKNLLKNKQFVDITQQCFALLP